jgi:hypothetical protein
MCAGAYGAARRRAIPSLNALDIESRRTAPMTAQPAPSFRTALFGFTASTLAMIAALLLLAGLGA